MKLCKDCKWSRPDRLLGDDYAKCLHPQLTPVDYSTGKPDPFYCSTKRANIWPRFWLAELIFGVHGCGPEGKRWEPRND